MSKFLIWHSCYIEGICVLTAPKKVEKGFQLQRGISRKEGWPTDNPCEMNSEFPKDLGLNDNLHGAGNVVVSKRLCDFLTKYGVRNVEYLPVQIINHKKKLASKDYFILNPLTIVDCIDIEASEVEWDVVQKDYIDSCAQLVIQEDRVPADVHLFRAKHLLPEIVVRQELWEALTAEGFKGLQFFRPAEKYMGG